MNERVETIKSWSLQQVGCPYIYGGTGQACTPEYRRARMDQYPEYADMIRQNCPQLADRATSCAGCKWAKDGVGRLAYDCAQLTRFALDTVGIALVSGANSQWQKTAYVIKGEIKDMPKNLLCLVYRQDDDKRMHHTGVYMGDGWVIHAKGHAYGVVREQLENINKPMTHYGIPAGLYTNDELKAAGIDPENNLPTLRRGSKGEAVDLLQHVLLADGYGAYLGDEKPIDGKFGQKTEQAVKAFQKDHGLTVDGVVGKKTWAELGVVTEQPEQPEEPEQPDEDEEPDDGTVRVPLERLNDWANIMEAIASDIRRYAGGG